MEHKTLYRRRSIKDRILFNLSCLYILIYMFIGCAQRVIYKDVYIPTKCDISIPQSPILSGDLVSDFVKALEHSELLERDLEFCVKGE